MTSRDFCYWLQGYFEIVGNRANQLSESQLNCVKNHLALVFKHEIDPSFGDEKKQEQLNQVHSGEIIGGPGPSGTLIRC